MTEQTTWLQTYGWIIAAAILLAAAATPVIIKQLMTKKQQLPHQPDAMTLIRETAKEENDLINLRRSELLAAFAAAAKSDKLRSIDSRISVCWYSADGIQGAVDAMLEAADAALSAETDAAQIRAGIVHPYILPVRMRLVRLRSALDEARSDHHPAPDNDDLRAFLRLEPLLQTDSTQTLLQKSAKNQQLLRRREPTEEYMLRHEQLLAAMLDIFDGEGSHMLEDKGLTAPEARAALSGIAEAVAVLRRTYTRP